MAVRLSLLLCFALLFSVAICHESPAAVPDEPVQQSSAVVADDVPEQQPLPAVAPVDGDKPVNDDASPQPVEPETPVDAPETVEKVVSDDVVEGPPQQQDSETSATVVKGEDREGRFIISSPGLKKRKLTSRRSKKRSKKNRKAQRTNKQVASLRSATARQAGTWSGSNDWGQFSTFPGFGLFNALVKGTGFGLKEPEYGPRIRVAAVEIYNDGQNGHIVDNEGDIMGYALFYQLTPKHPVIVTMAVAYDDDDDDPVRIQSEIRAGTAMYSADNNEGPVCSRLQRVYNPMKEEGGGIIPGVMWTGNAEQIGSLAVQVPPSRITLFGPNSIVGHSLVLYVIPDGLAGCGTVRLLA